jgi:hypothetical protein
MGSSFAGMRTRRIVENIAKLPELVQDSAIHFRLVRPAGN